jgi:hypothetical protein
MIKLNSIIEEKKANFGAVRNVFHSHGCSFCSNFDYDQGKFDAVLWREGGETIYLRVPFYVLEGELDHSNAYIQFGTPYVIKHVVNIGLDYDENSFLTATTGLAQFQEPLDKDGYINDKSRWAKAGEETIERIVNSMNELLSS